MDSFGLCSYDDPIQVLKELNRVVKRDGHIILLEHGRGLYGWINTILDRNAYTHAHHWGCVYNLDMEDIVRKSGLEMVSVSRWHFGTTYIIRAKPCKE
ncbi:methyltransferase domain-containing protein [archaeon]|nr:MAG: methyltransferase domain-containing protein [archaeon]